MTDLPATYWTLRQLADAEGVSYKTVGGLIRGLDGIRTAHDDRMAVLNLFAPDAFCC